MTAMREAPKPVSAQDLQLLLSQLEQMPGKNTDGFFGPASTTRRVNRECAVFLGAGRAALLQLAHPWVAAALQQHSSLMNDAIGRFHSTFRVIYTMLFGTRAQALSASRQLYKVHTSIQGQLPEAVGGYRQHEPYAANEITALRWVFATLVESAVLAYEFVLPPLGEQAHESYYSESKRMAALCGIPSQLLPPDWAALRSYVAEMLNSPAVAVDAKACSMAQAVLSGVGTWVRAPRWYRALTAFWLPPRLRSGFGLPFGPEEQDSLQRTERWLPGIYRHIPGSLRFVGPYHEAEARLRHSAPNFLVRQSNLFWMGTPRLLYPDQTPQRGMDPC